MNVYLVDFCLAVFVLIAFIIAGFRYRVRCRAIQHGEYTLQEYDRAVAAARLEGFRSGHLVGLREARGDIKQELRKSVITFLREQADLLESVSTTPKKGETDSPPVEDSGEIIYLPE